VKRSDPSRVPSGQFAGASAWGFGPGRRLGDVWTATLSAGVLSLPFARPRMASAAANPPISTTAQTTMKSRGLKIAWLYCLPL
jgi:hypothetical protein